MNEREIANYPISRNTLPPSIAALLGAAAYRRDEIGRSDARVYVFDDYVLKARPAGGWDTRDAQVLRWLTGKLPVPAVAAHEVRDGTDWLLMTRVRGRMLCAPSVMEKPTLLIDCMAEALHMLWSVPVSDCPFEYAIEDGLARGEAAIRSGAFDTADCEPETFGPGGFKSPEALVRWLRENRPPVDPVFAHGDFCLPNLFTDGRRLTGFIDLGNAGVCDRWMDLALGWRSLKHNSDGRFGTRYPDVDPDDLFRAAGVPKDAEKLRYYILLDELY